MSTLALRPILEYGQSHFKNKPCSLIRYLKRQQPSIINAAMELKGEAIPVTQDIVKILDSVNSEEPSEADINDLKDQVSVLIDLTPETDLQFNLEIFEAQNKPDWAKIVSLAVTFVVLFFGNGILGPLVAFPPNLNLERIIYGVQVIVIFIFLITQHNRLLKLDSRIPANLRIAKETLRQFTTGWLFMWSGWFLLYYWFYIHSILVSFALGSPKLDVLDDIFNVASGFAIWWCYLVLDMPSVNIDNKNRNTLFYQYVCIVGVYGLVSAIMAIGDRINHWDNFGVVLVGVFNGLGLASLTGRLGSHFIDMPKPILICLYNYAMLQVIYSFLPVVKGHEVWVPAIFILALIFKTILAFGVVTMIKSGGFMRYLDAAEVGLLNITVSRKTL